MIINASFEDSTRIASFALPTTYKVGFADTDNVANRIINEYEEQLFLQNDASRGVWLAKTQEQGAGLYDSIKFGQHLVSLPKPFLFTLRPADGHPNAKHAQKVSRILCAYDNAGESFEPGHDSPNSPVTRHLASSRVLMFLYDPTQDVRFRTRCKEISADPQLNGQSRRQETLFNEAASRIRRYLGLATNRKHERPIIIVVPNLH